MKRSAFAFLSLISFMLLAVPAINIIKAPSRDAVKLREKSFLYNMDFASRWTALLLYPLGISTDPNQVIIGKDDWLYLGDQYLQTVSDDRRAAKEADISIGKEIGAATNAWNAYLAGKGVKVFRIMIGPNKGSIYPEHMPSWARPALSNPTDALIAEVGQEHIIDLRPPLLAAKAKYGENLYFKTDTHWNALGAGVAFRAFAQQIQKADPELIWPPERVYELTGVTPRNGGDLANFLRLTASLSDSAPQINLTKLPVKTVQIDFATKKIISQGGNPQIGAPDKPLLVKSVGALNDKKVLWLRDSFGTSLSPLMAETFSEVLQLHWGRAIGPSGNFARLVDEWKPDYVFVTVVERAARTNGFTSYPPPSLIQKGMDFKTTTTTASATANHLARGPSEKEYQVNGIDPYVDFEPSSSAGTVNARYLSIDLACADSSPSVPLQLFWIGEGQSSYDEVHSAKFSLLTGQMLIDLRTIPKWPSRTAIKRVRIDIDSVNSCVQFKLTNPSFGIKTRAIKISDHITSAFKPR